MATDSFGRRIDYLRISLTDRCNLRCVYCMPAGGVEWRPHHEMLTLEQIELFAAIAVEEGVSKIRLTGGEPLVRKGVLGHVARLKAMTGIEGIALTTNGILLPKYAEELVAAGLSRVNVSIDSLDPEVYRRVTRGGDLAQALAGLDAAQRAGMRPLKLNTVVMRGLAADPFDFARLSLERPLHVRFIEFMPVGNQASREAEPDAWMKGQVVPAAEILERVSEAGVRAGVGELQPLTRDEAPGGWGPAMYHRFRGAAGTVCVISPLSNHFCGQCNRLRLTADGKLRTCLFSDDEIDVAPALRGGSVEEVRRLIRGALSSKPEGHGMRVGTGRTMSQIGG